MNTPYFQPDTFDQIENEIRTFSQNYKYISLFGDFNSRTAEEPDFIDFEINEHEEKTLLNFYKWFGYS